MAGPLGTPLGPAAHGGFSLGVRGRGQGCPGMQRWSLHPEGPLQQGSAVSPPGPGPTAPGGQVPPQAHTVAGEGGGHPWQESRAGGPPPALGTWANSRTPGGSGDEQEGTGWGWGQVQAGRGPRGTPASPWQLPLAALQLIGCNFTQRRLEVARSQPRPQSSRSRCLKPRKDQLWGGRGGSISAQRAGQRQGGAPGPDSGNAGRQGGGPGLH